MSTRQRNVFLIVFALCLVSIILNVFLFLRKLSEPKTKTDADKQIEELVMVVSGLKEELEDTQARLQQESDNHAKFVEKLTQAQSEQDINAVRVITARETEEVSLRSELSGIMQDIKKLSVMNKGPEKDKLLGNVTRRFERFADNAGMQIVDESTRKKILELLGNSMAKQDDTKDPKDQKVKGHYLFINKYMKSILEKI